MVEELTISQTILANLPEENETPWNYYRRIAGLKNSTLDTIRVMYKKLVKKGLVPMIGMCKTKGCIIQLPQTKIVEQKPIISGSTINSEHKVNFVKDLLPGLIQLGEHTKEKIDIKNSQSIVMPKGPFMLVLLSDVHGGAKSDYKTIVDDLDTINRTKDCHVVVAGDMTDNFIIGSLNNLQKFQPTAYPVEQEFARWFCETVQDKLLVWVSGNHDNWTYKVSGIDIYKTYLKNAHCLYDRNEVIFDLCYNDLSDRWLIRHKWKGNSIFNPTHGMEVAWERSGKDYDVSVGGHTHIATLCREFIKHDKRRHAILLGTYKLADEYGKEIGFADTHSDSRGSGAFVYDKQFNKIWFDKLDTAAGYLDYLKSK